MCHHHSNITNSWHYMVVWFSAKILYSIIRLIDLEEFSTSVCTHSIMCNKNLPFKCWVFSSSFFNCGSVSAINICLNRGPTLQLVLFWCLFCLKFKFFLFPMHVITPTLLNISMELITYYIRSCITPHSLERMESLRLKSHSNCCYKIFKRTGSISNAKIMMSSDEGNTYFLIY